MKIANELVLISDVRGSYLQHLIVPAVGEEIDQKTGKPKQKWSGSWILDKVQNADTIKILQEATKKLEARAAESKIHLKAGLRALHEGTERQFDTQGNPREGYDEKVMYLVTNTTRKPRVFRAQFVNGKPVEITDPLECYSGAYYRAHVSLYVYQNAKGNGITASLNWVQFLRDGEPFTSGPGLTGLTDVSTGESVKEASDEDGPIG